MKADRNAIPRFLADPGIAVPAVLLYGPDQGLVKERGSQLVRKVAGSLDDPFRVADIAPDSLGDDPARLSDEANAMSMLGGRRAVRVSGAADRQTKAIESFLTNAKDGALALVVIEAGDLGPASSLRKLFEGAKTALAIPCYHDSRADIASLIATELKGYDLAPDAQAYLAQALGGDRAMSRAELAKLALYMGDAMRIALADAVACVGDQAAFRLDDLCQAMSEGDGTATDLHFERNLTEMAAIGILRALGRHFMKLHVASGRVAAGESADRAMAAIRPPLYPNQREKFGIMLRRWPPAAIGVALNRIAETETLAMRHHDMAETLARRLGQELAAMARRVR